MSVLAMKAECHFEGLAQAAKYHRDCLDNRQSAKLRLIDDAFHLCDHLTPESCSVFLNEIKATVNIGDMLPPPPPPLEGPSYASMEPDALEIWFADANADNGYVESGSASACCEKHNVIGSSDDEVIFFWLRERSNS